MFKSKAVKFKNEFASAEIFLMEDEKARLRSVYSTKRNQGYASEVLQQVVDYADEKELSLYLVVQRFGKPKDGLTNEQLEKFYYKFGFRKIKHKGNFTMMCRKKGSQKSQAL